MDVNDLLKQSGLRNLIDPQVIDLERVLLTAHIGYMLQEIQLQIMHLESACSFQ